MTATNMCSNFGGFRCSPLFKVRYFFTEKKNRFWESLWEDNTLLQQHTLIGLHLSEVTSYPVYFIISMDQEKSFVKWWL